MRRMRSHVDAMPSATLVLSMWLCLASTAMAEDHELCGRSHFWSHSCDAGERCDIRFRLGWLQVGVCVEEAEGCGGLAGSACAGDAFCDYAPEAQCGAADQSGICRPRPEVCTKEYQPVCGCDGRTHGNRCEANEAGVSVVSQGPCPSSACGDGSALLCDQVPSPCPVAGEVREVVRGCYGRCVEPRTCRPTHCEYEGYAYPVNSVFYARHSCNTCGCYDEGQVVCGTRNCPCGSPNGLTWLPLDPATCRGTEISCPEPDTESFHAYCGCGCASRTYVEPLEDAAPEPQ